MGEDNSKTSWSRGLRLDKRFDWVGPPDEISKIRPIRLRRLADETQLEQNYREAREALNHWSSQFWAEHNTLFESKKVEFVKEKMKHMRRLEHSSSIDMSEFYRRFLNERHDSLIKYNKEWYYRNIVLFWTAFKIRLIRFQRALIKSLCR